MIRVPKTTLELKDSLEGFTGMGSAVILTAVVYCSERIQIKIGKWRKVHVQKKPYASFQESLPVESDGGTFSPPRMGELVYDNAYTVLPTKEAHPGFGIQLFWGDGEG